MLECTAAGADVAEVFVELLVVINVTTVYTVSFPEEW